MVADLRKAGIEVKTDRPRAKEAKDTEMAEIKQIVYNFKGSFFTDRIGKVKTKPVRLEYQTGFQPIQPQRYQVPYHYQRKLSKHLQKLREKDVIEDVSPRKLAECISNVAISEKKMTSG